MILRCTAQALRPRGVSGAQSRRNAVSLAGSSLKASAGISVVGAHWSLSRRRRAISAAMSKVDGVFTEPTIPYRLQ